EGLRPSRPIAEKTKCAPRSQSFWRIPPVVERCDGVPPIGQFQPTTIAFDNSQPFDLLPPQVSRKAATCLVIRPTGKPGIIFIASGSEVSLAIQAHEELEAEGIRSRVVSMPSWDICEQSKEYRDTVLPPEVKARVAIEQASTLGW